MLSKQTRANLIASLMTAENAEIIEQLLTDDTEISGYLAGCGTVTETEDSATFVANTPAEDGYKQKYEDLQRKYVERFMNGNSDPEADQDAPAEETEETPAEETEDSIEDLFKEEN